MPDRRRRMDTAETLGARRVTAARIAESREALWRLALRAALLCARARNLCRRSRWEAGRARRLLRKRVLRDAVVGSPRVPPKRTRHRSTARLVAVRPVR